MSLTAPAHARNLQTNINQSRYFFATQEAGEQELFLSTISGGGPNGNISSLAVGISGPAGNAVVVSEGPSYMASEFISADQGAIFGSGSTYWTGSTITSTITGISFSSDRIAGSGIACIESYGGNGSIKGFEFLSRGVDSALQSTSIDSYFASIGSPGAVAKIGETGQLVAGQAVVAPLAVALSAPDTGSSGVGALTISDLSGGSPFGRWSWYKYGVVGPGNTGSDLALGAYDNNGNFIASALTARRSTGEVATINGYTYPQAVVSIAPSTVSPGAVSVPNATPTVVLTIPAAGAGLIAGANYSTDINITLTATNALATAVWLQMGVRLGGNGAFNYENPIYVPVGGIPVNIAFSLNQISDMGSSSTNIDIIAYQQSVPGGTITVTASTSSASPPHLLKMVT